VYEDGVRQQNVSVNIEHSHVSVALLMEGGSRYHEINKFLGNDVPRLGRELLSILTPDDKIAVFKYDAKLQTLADFGQSPSQLDGVFNHFSVPNISEANFYDALLETMARMKNVPDRKAVIVISSGVDTFSKASFQDVLRTAEGSAVPIYTIGLGPMMQLEGDVVGPSAPFARIDWNGAERQLEQLAKASGGRAYTVESTLAIPGIYDDIMENLRVRYVVSYVSSNPATVGPPRKVQVELIDPQTGDALKIHDANGKPVAAKIYVQESFSLEKTPGD
jgi:VWFA-related protein